MILFRRCSLAICFVLLTFSVGVGQEPDSTVLAADYTMRAETPDLELTVVHLNDITTDSLFAAPAKYALRAQARQNLMFYVQGVAKNDTFVDRVFELAQTNSVTAQTSVYPASIVNISNFEAGLALSEGDQFQGILVSTSPEGSVRLISPFEVRFGDQKYPVWFRLTGEAVARLEQ